MKKKFPFFKTAATAVTLSGSLLAALPIYAGAITGMDNSVSMTNNADPNHHILIYGDNNTYTNDTTGHFYGTDGTIKDTVSINSIFGSRNTYSNTYSSVMVGDHNIAEDVDINLMGQINHVSGVYGNVLGDVNTVSIPTPDTGSPLHDVNYVNVLGDKNQITGNRAAVFGESNTVSGTDSVAVGNLISIIADNAVALGNGSVATRKNTVSIGSDSLKRQMTHVADGTEVDDAVNKGQLDKAVNSLADALGGGAATDPNTGTVTAPTYVIQGNTYNNVGDAFTSIDQTTTKIINGELGLVKTDGTTVTVDKDGTATAVDLGGANGSRVVTGIADGVGTNDAVNKGQLDALAAQTDDRFQALGNRTDSQMRDLSSQMHANRKIAAQGVASAMAMQIEMPQPEPGRFAGGVGLGAYDGATAIAVGVRYRSTSGRFHVGAAVSGGLTSHVKAGGRISVGFLF